MTDSDKGKGRGGVTQDELATWFRYHVPTTQHLECYNRVREAGHMFAKIVVGHTVPSADQTAAVRKIREAVMTANAAIACRVGGES